MSRLLCRLFAARTPTKPATRGPSLGLELLETRETPSGFNLAQMMQHVSHVVNQAETAYGPHGNHPGTLTAAAILSR